MPETWFSMQGFDTLSLLTDVHSNTGIVGGTTYKVQVRAKNKYGWGLFGMTGDVRCAKPPDASSWITTANSSTFISISWHEPFNNGLTIEKYIIKIMKKGSGAEMIDPANWHEATECDGTVPTIVSDETCMVPMQTLRAAPYFYMLND